MIPGPLIGCALSPLFLNLSEVIFAFLNLPFYNIRYDAVPCAPLISIGGLMVMHKSLLHYKPQEEQQAKKYDLTSTIFSITRTCRVHYSG